MSKTNSMHRPKLNPAPVKTGTQQHKVLEYLRTGHSLDLPKAFGLWGHIRLSDVILKLREKGYEIITDIATTASGAEFGIYRLKSTVKRARVTKGTYKGVVGGVVESDNGFVRFTPEGSRADTPPIILFRDQIELLEVADAAAK